MRNEYLCLLLADRMFDAACVSFSSKDAYVLRRVHLFTSSPRRRDELVFESCAVCVPVGLQLPLVLGTPPLSACLIKSTYVPRSV